MTRPPSTLASRLKAARAHAGFTQEQLAEAVGLGQGDISKMENGRSLKTHAMARLADVLGVSARWLELGDGPEPAFLLQGSASSPALVGVARDLSPSIRYIPLSVTWEQVQKMETLPEEFELTLLDDAMAPAAPAGSVVTFRRANSPSVGEAVLVRDKRGNMYFRECRAKVGGGWLAFSYRPAFPTLDDVDDQLEVLAVFVGMRAPWSQLTR